MGDLKTQGLTVVRGGARLVDQVAFEMTRGELIALIGPNGAGKTTFLRAALGLIKPDTGTATLNGADTAQLKPGDRAQLISYLPQSRPLAWPTLVKDVVALGRYSYGARLGNLYGDDATAVDQALKDCDIEHLKDRRAHSLSGGESARMHCARAFAAQTPLLLADEPVAALDPRHQFRIMELIKTYVEKGGGALVVLHDINLAVRFATRLAWMKNGQIIADGTPEETLTAKRLSETFGIAARVDNLRVDFEGTL